MSPARPRLPVHAGPAAFLEAYTDVVRPETTRHARAYWDFSCTGRPEAQEVVAEVEEWLSDLHADERVYVALSRWQREPTGNGPVDRQVDVLLPDYRRAQVDETLRKKVIQLSLKVEETYTVFRAELDGRSVGSNELDRRLVTETDDAGRRAVWEATRAVGSRVRERVVELVRLRNEQASQLGFADYFALALDDEEMTPVLLDSLLSSMREATEEPWRRLKAGIDAELAELRGKDAADLMPWDYPDRFLQSVPRDDVRTSLDPWFTPTRIGRLAKTFFRGVGLPIEGLWQASDMMPREGKYPHAFCIGIDNPHDVRVLCNLDATARWMETTLHEFGHALYNSLIDPDLPWLLRESAHTFVTEGVAMFFGRLAKDADWLTTVADVPPERAQAAAERLREAQLVFARWGMAVTAFERAMYADPTGDLDSEWWRIVGDLQGLRRPDGWDRPDWASKVHIACYPAYYQNYLLGEMYASQLGAALRGRVGGPHVVGRTEVGDHFVELFRAGRAVPWPQTVVASTGTRLSPAAWGGEFGGEA